MERSGIPLLRNQDVTADLGESLRACQAAGGFRHESMEETGGKQRKEQGPRRIHVFPMASQSLSFPVAWAVVGAGLLGMAQHEGKLRR